MSSILKMLAGSKASTPLYVDDVFSAYTRTGTGASAAITTGIDLSTNGGCVWTKARSAATGHRLQFTAIGAGTELVTDTTGASASAAQGVTSFDTDGHTIGTDTDYNNSTGPVTYVDWTFRNAPKFFDHATVTKSASSNATVDFADLETLGMVRVKRTDSTGSWYVWHKDLTAGKLLIGETTAAEATLGHITVSGTTVTLVDGTIADGDYLVEAWAHDSASDGMIQCGSFTTSGTFPYPGSSTLGWEPQFVLVKSIDAAGASDPVWYMLDTSRGMSVGVAGRLQAQSSSAEEPNYNRASINATGVDWVNFPQSATYIYIAIRRSNKPPTAGTEVYNAIARTGTGAAATVTGVGFAPDSAIIHARSLTGHPTWGDRLRGASNRLSSATTSAEGADTAGISGIGMDGLSLGSDGLWGSVNVSGTTYINHFFRRAPGFFDVVCDTGTGSAHTISHNLTVAPELMIRKKRSGADAWYVYHANNTANPETDYLVLNATDATADLDTIWNDTAPTASVFSVGTHDDVNQSTGTFVTYLFATLAGISKCGTYTGNGSTQNIEMGFAAGARFFLVKATSTTGNWVLFDSVRGVVAGNDPYLLLNSTAAEDTDEDAVDPYTGGITVNETTASNINTNSVIYCYIAIA